ncbi:MAG: molybdopterin molybdotransferase [Acidimicrobiales bacterium]|jgi:molybdopterin molybdotransferase
MISLEEAQARIDRDISVLAPVRRPIGETRGQVLAESVSSAEAIPPFDNTAMDGFAVRASDTVGASEDAPVNIPVVATIAAGSVADRPLEAGEVMRIMTGAPMPDGADAVIMVELTRPAGETAIELLAEVPVGNHVRPAGDDLSAGVVVFSPGEVITAGHIGVMASVGVAEVLVHPRPRVGVFSTGDELMVGPVELGPGQIRDSNRPTLLALVEEAGCEAIDLGLLRDDEAVIEAALLGAVGAEGEDARVDVLLTSGGVSMGDFDFVKSVLGRLGDMNWMQVAIKPAKPLAFGLLGSTPVFGLPGNPVSSMVSFELFARPGLRKMMGRPDTGRPMVMALADEPLRRHNDDKTHFQRVVVAQQADGAWRVRSAGGQGSHQLSAMATANGLAVLPPSDGVDEGGVVRVMQLDLG